MVCLFCLFLRLEGTLFPVCLDNDTITIQQFIETPPPCDLLAHPRVYFTATKHQNTWSQLDLIGFLVDTHARTHEVASWPGYSCDLVAGNRGWTHGRMVWYSYGLVWTD
ncbi:hypothetical protein BC567DRAFT_72771 [Phyllosticta citribraziliensis]